jgi:hypothetical protein
VLCFLFSSARTARRRCVCSCTTSCSCTTCSCCWTSPTRATISSCRTGSAPFAIVAPTRPPVGSSCETSNRRRLYILYIFTALTNKSTTSRESTRVPRRGVLNSHWILSQDGRPISKSNQLILEKNGPGLGFDSLYFLHNIFNSPYASSSDSALCNTYLVTDITSNLDLAIFL